MSDPAKPKKVICRVVCDGVELKLTLTPKFLEKTLVDALINPYLGVFNKKRPDDPPVTADSLKRVEVNAKAVAIDSIAKDVLAGPKAHDLADTNPRVELFPPWSTAPAYVPPKPAAPA